MKMEQTECSETSAYKIQTPGNYPEESIQQVTHVNTCDCSVPYCVYNGECSSILVRHYIVC